MTELQSLIEAVKSQIRNLRSIQKNRVQHEANLAARRETIAQLQRQLAIDEAMLVDTQGQIESCLDRLYELQHKRKLEENATAIEKLLALQEKAEQLSNEEDVA